MSHSSRPEQSVDVTDVFEHYRLLARELWNQGFWSQADLRSLTSLQKHFEVISGELFEALVLERLAINDERFRFGEEWAGLVGVLPTLPIVTLQVLELRPQGGFDVEFDRSVSAEGLHLVFQKHFEWGYLSYVDLSDILVKIESCKEDPSLVGRDALVKGQFFRITVR